MHRVSKSQRSAFARTASVATIALVAAAASLSPAVAQDNAEAKSLAAALAAPTSWTAPGDSFAARPALEGKSIYTIVSGQSAAFVQEFIAGLNDAAAVVGASVNVQDSAYDSTKAAELIDKAIAGGAAVIVTQSVDSSAVAAAISSARDAGVPVIEATSRDAGPVPEDLKAMGVTAISSFCYSCAGEQMAQSALADATGPVHALIYNVPGVVVSTRMVEGFTAELARLCADCSVTVVDAPAADWEANLATLTTSNLQINPQLNTLVPVFDAMVGLIEPALAASGLTGVSIVSYNATAPALQMLADKNLVTGDVGGSPYWLGWATVDQAARIAGGLAPVDDVKVPHRLFDASNIASIDLSQPQQAWYGAADIVADYKTLWQAN